MISERDKLRCVQRELRMRQNVYAMRVKAGRMTQEDADREIALMGAIVADYERACGIGSLFEESTP